MNDNSLLQLSDNLILLSFWETFFSCSVKSKDCNFVLMCDFSKNDLCWHFDSYSSSIFWGIICFNLAESGAVLSDGWWISSKNHIEKRHKFSIVSLPDRNLNACMLQICHFPLKYIWVLIVQFWLGVFSDAWHISSKNLMQFPQSERHYAQTGSSVGSHGARNKSCSQNSWSAAWLKCSFHITWFGKQYDI